MPNCKLTKKRIDAIQPTSKRVIYWDTELRGFGLIVMPSGIRSYVVQYRTKGGRAGTTRRYTIGRHGSPWTVDQAPDKAKKLLGLAADDKDPAADKQKAKRDMTISALCDLYLEEGIATKKASTVATDRGRIERHIKKLVGRKRISEFTRADAEKFLRDVAQGKSAADVRTGKRGRAIVRGGRGTATRTMGLLGGILTFAVDRGLLDANPVRGVKRYADRRNERFLSDAELARLGQALREAEKDPDGRKAVCIIRLLTLTGCRYSEIAELKWPEVRIEQGMLVLGESKTGHKTVLLNAPALSILSDLAESAEGEFVFPAMPRKTGNGKQPSDALKRGHYQGTPKRWRQIREQAELNDVRLHDLRHTFASAGAASGLSLPLIGMLLGHKDSATTQRYTHLADDPARKANDKVGRYIADAMDAPASNSTVVPIVRR